MVINLGGNYNDGTVWKWRGWQRDLLKLYRKFPKIANTVPRQGGKTAFAVKLIEDFIFRYTERAFPCSLITAKTCEQAYALYFKRLDQLLSKLPESLYIKQGSVSSGHMTVTIKRPWVGDYVTVEIVGTGNANALKGRTIDLLVSDEAAFYDKDILFDVLLPTMDDVPKAKAFITSTVNGMNHYYDLFHSWEKLQKERVKTGVAAFNRTLDTIRLRTKEWIDNKRALYAAAGKLHKFNQEYYNDWNAAPAEVLPFSIHVSDTLSNKAHIPAFTNKNCNYLHMFVNVDLGKKGNMATWSWAYTPKGRVHIFNYKDDDEHVYDMLDRLMQVKVRYISVILPWDGENPSNTEGKSIIDLMREYMNRRGYSRRMSIHKLPRTKNRKHLLMETMTNLPLVDWDLNTTIKGLERLSQVKQPENKEGYVTFGKFVENGHQHSGDAFMYIFDTIKNNVGRVLQSYGDAVSRHFREYSAKIHGGYDENPGKSYIGRGKRSYITKKD